MSVELKLPPIYHRKWKRLLSGSDQAEVNLYHAGGAVRQKVISYLTDTLKVPSDMIVVEQHLSHYGLNTKKRADIVIHKPDKDSYLHGGSINLTSNTPFSIVI